MQSEIQEAVAALPVSELSNRLACFSTKVQAKGFLFHFVPGRSTRKLAWNAVQRICRLL